MNAFSITLSLAIFLTVFITPVAAQWDEEQDHVRALAQSLPLKEIEVYLGSSLVRAYHYDFYRNYTGFSHGTGSKNGSHALLLLYDDEGFLTEETHITGEEQEKTTLYEYDSLGNRIKEKKCQQIAKFKRDSVTKKSVPTGKHETSCSTTVTEFNEQGLPVKRYNEYKGEMYLFETLEYENFTLKKITYFSNDTIYYEEVWDYDNAGRKVLHWLQKGTDKKLKTEWHYNEAGQLKSITHHDVQYTYPYYKARQEEIRLVDFNHTYTCSFKYDKKGRVSDLFTNFEGGRKSPDIYFKYIEPDK